MDSVGDVTFHALSGSQMLPAVCPVCTAPGTRAVTLSCIGTAPPAQPPEAFYCDICADAHQKSTTVYLAWYAALTLLILALVTAGALSWGTRELAGQFFAALFVGAALPYAGIRLGIWKRPETAIAIEGSPDRLKCSSPPYAQVLREHGVGECEAPAKAKPQSAWKEVATLTAVSMAWLTSLHTLGGATVRVLVGGDEPAVLVVDSRHHGRVDPANSEDPRSGAFARVLGGRRKFELLADSGTILSSATKTIWPGRTYIVGQLPAGQCLFWERRKYGAEPKSLFVPLGGSGPIWELRDPVDSWFIPLQVGAGAGETEEAAWESSGGERRAIRLLPCRAAGQ